MPSHEQATSRVNVSDQQGPEYVDVPETTPVELTATTLAADHSLCPEK